MIGPRVQSKIRFALDEPLTVLSIDDGIESLLGFGNEEFLTSRVSLKDRIHPEDADIAGMLFSPRLEEETGSFNIRLRHADGRIRCVRGEYSKECAAEGGKTVLNLLLQDAKSLYESRVEPASLTTIEPMMAIADGALYFKNRDHVYTAANRQAELTFAGPGDGNPGLPGKTDYDLFPEMYADAYYRLEKEVFAGSPGASETQALPDEDGKKRWVESRKFALKDPGGRIIGLFCVSIGITENMKASQELQAAEQEYRSIFDGALEGMFRIGLDSRVQIANRAAARILGYDSPQDVLESVKAVGRDIWLDRNERARYMRMVSEDEAHAVLGFECQFKCKDGTPLWVSLNSRLVFGNDGQPVCYEGFFVDIAERKRVEAALRESEESLRDAQKIAGLGSYVTDIVAGTWTSSEVLDGLFGIGKEYERNVEGWGALVHSDDRADMVTYFVDEVIGQRRPFDREYRIVRHSDGAVRWVHGLGRLDFDAQGQPVKMHGTIKDITERKQADVALRENKELLRLFIEHAPVALSMYDREMRYLAVSRRYIEEYDLAGREIIGHSHYEMHPWVTEELKEVHRRALKGETIRCAEHRRERPDGTILWARWEVRPWRAGDGAIGGIVLFTENISEQKEAEQRLRLAASVFSNAREGIMITDPAGTILEVNEMFTRITGYPRDEAIGKNSRLLSSGLQSAEFYANMWRCLLEDGRWSGEVWNRNKSGEVFAETLTINAVRDAGGNLLQYVALFSDVTQLKEHERQLEHVANYDVLTSLPNRTLFADRLRQAMVLPNRGNRLLAVAYLDLDGFKSINDRHGHDAGDRLLTSLAFNMKCALRKGDTLSRLGGDEFVAVMLDLDDAESSAPVLNRLLEAASELVQVGDLSLSVTASVGVTFYPQEFDLDADSLLRQADQAMYQAKLAGGHRYHIFDPEHDHIVRGRHENLERVRQAMAAHEFALYYQPKVNMRTGKVVGAEALIRWQHPERGLLPPGMFLPVIEEHPLAIELGEWVIDTALSQIECWSAAGLEMAVSVNVGALQLQQPDFVDRLSAILALHPGVKASSLELEVLETSALQDVVQTSQVLNACHNIGVSFALDDFGTGYSSLTYLKRLPASILKIDQSFVSDMLDDPENLNILEGILGLAAAFHRQVIAEGVETVEHGTMLLRLGCELAQGYGIARPMPAGDLPGWVSAWRPDSRWAEAPLVHSGNRALLSACVEHRAWLAAFESFLQGKRHSPPVLDPHRCRLGVWLDAEKEAGHGESPGYQTFASSHRLFHELASSIVAAQAQGNSSEGIARIGELHGKCDNLMAKLELMQQSC
jgi:diguanylate cyclase (GGDEF)-like protein/PAS domain S-box-containing protein